MNIALFCAAGMSTSLLVNKMKDAAAKRGLDATIAAYSEGDLKAKLSEIDVALLGPQVAFKLKQDKELGAAAGVPVEAIPMQLYGMMDGEKVLQLAIDLVEGK